MKTKLLRLIPFLLVLPIVFIGQAGQNVAFSAEGDCYSLSGDSADSATFNTGYADGDYYGTACVDPDGNLDGAVRSSNLGMMYLDVSDRSHAVATVDLADADGDGLAEWSGYAYAPLNPYLPISTYGTWFDLSGVWTDLADGSVHGVATNSNVGYISFEGLTQALPLLQVGIGLYIETYGDTRSTDGLPVADGGASGYTVVAEIDLSEVPYEITEDFLAEDFMFEALLWADLTVSDLRLDQVGGTGVQNDAIVRGVYFTDPVIDGDIVYYYFDLGSYSPTTDALCGYVDLEVEN